MISIGWIGLAAFFLVAAFFLLAANRWRRRTQLFVERAVDCYLKNENPIGLHFILIAYSTMVGPEKQIVWAIVKKSKTVVEQMSEGTEKQRRLLRLGKISEELRSLGEGSYALKKRLSREFGREYFSAWRRKDLSIFDHM